MKVTLMDVQKRIYSLNENASIVNNETTRFTDYNAFNDPNMSLKYLRNWKRYYINESSLELYLELFQSICEFGHTGQIIEASQIISEGPIQKTRDSKQMRSYLKRKLGHIKSKISTRTNNNVKNAINDMNNIGKAIQNNTKNNMSKITGTNKNNSQNQKQTQKENTIISACNSISESMEKLIHCDRMIQNYNNLSRRFNLDKIVKENYINGIYDTTAIICRLVDTYNMSTKIKLNSVMESTLYTMKKLGFTDDPKDIIKAATDYFLMKENGLQDCKTVLNSSVFFSESDIKNCCNYILENTIYEEEQERKIVIENFLLEHAPRFEDRVIDVSELNDTVYSLQRVLGPYAYASTFFNSRVENPYINSYIYLTSAITLAWLSAIKNANELPLVNDGKLRAIVEPLNLDGKLDKFINGIYRNEQDNYFLLRFYFTELDLRDDEYIEKYALSIIKSIYDQLEKNGFDKIINLIYESRCIYIRFSNKKVIEIIEKDKYQYNSNRSDDNLIESSINDFLMLNKKRKDLIFEEDFIQTDKDNNKNISKFQKIVNDFKSSNEDKKENKLKALMMKLYTKNIENIVEETPNLLQYIRTIFILGSCAINPVCAAILAIADYFISIHVDRNETEKMLKALDKEKKKVEKKLEKETDEEKIERLEKYNESLNKSYDKINEYYESLLTEKELDAKYDDTDEEIEKDTFKNILDDSDDDSFDESSINLLRFIPLVESNIYIKLCDVVSIIENRIASIPDSIIVDAAKISRQIPGIIDESRLKEVLNNTRKSIKEGNIKIEGIANKYSLIDSINEAMMVLNDDIKLNEYSCRDIYEAYNISKSIKEFYEAFNMIEEAYNNYSPILEMSFKNTISMAKEKLKNIFTKLSDKEKTISKNIDLSMSNLERSIENSFKNDNREQVIKGSILPSASKVIKLAITSGVAWAINPALAVIGLLGYIGCSAKYKQKERQLIVDEIEIELKMVQKYLDIAESKNDLKATKQLLEIQRKLERQRQRIKYKIAVKDGDTRDVDKTPTEGID